MPRVKPLTTTERQNREFLAALRAGQARKGEKDRDTAQLLEIGSNVTFWRRTQNPEKFSLADLRRLAKRYEFTDRELCLMCGVKYNGATP